MSYFSSVKKCLSLIYFNKILLAPDLLFALLTGFLFYGVVYVNDLSFLFTQVELQADYFLRTILSDTPRLVQLAVTGLLALILNIVFGLSLISTRLVLVDSVLRKRKVNIFAAYREGYSYFFKLFWVKFAVILLYGLVFLLGAVLVYSYPAYWIPLLLVVLLLMLLFKLAFLFVYPLLLRKKKSAFASLQASVRYFLEKKKHVIYTFFIFFLLSLVVQLVLSVLSQLVASFVVLATIMSVLTFFVSALLTVFVTLFLFDQY